MSEKCHVPFNIPYVLLDNNTKLNNILNEGESLNYECIHGYTRMTNVTCIQGDLIPQPLCEPSRYKNLNLDLKRKIIFFPLFV